MIKLITHMIHQSFLSTQYSNSSFPVFSGIQEELGWAIFVIQITTTGAF